MLLKLKIKKASAGKAQLCTKPVPSKSYNQKDSILTKKEQHLKRKQVTMLNCNEQDNKSIKKDRMFVKKDNGDRVVKDW